MKAEENHSETTVWNPERRKRSSEFRSKYPAMLRKHRCHDYRFHFVLIRMLIQCEQTNSNFKSKSLHWNIESMSKPELHKLQPKTVPEKPNRTKKNLFFVLDLNSIKFPKKNSNRIVQLKAERNQIMTKCVMTRKLTVFASPCELSILRARPWQT